MIKRRRKLGLLIILALLTLPLAGCITGDGGGDPMAFLNNRLVQVIAVIAIIYFVLGRKK